MSENYFRDLLAVECATDKKGKLTYVSWIEAWTRLKGKHPGATYEVHQTENGSFLHGEGLVMVSVTVPGVLPPLPDIVEFNLGITHTMWLPVMDGRNNEIKEPTTTDINKAIMRCLAKACAMHGLGSYVYMGEDLPVVSAEPNYPVKVLELAEWTETAGEEGLKKAEARSSEWPELYAAQAARIIRNRRESLARL